MFLYLDLACEQAKREHLWLTKERLYQAIVEGAAKRLRPKFVSFASMAIGLVPIL
jgi:Cu(I)/Ag(I) efflux system membrane protein CusA/SilA